MSSQARWKLLGAAIIAVAILGGVVGWQQLSPRPMSPTTIMISPTVTTTSASQTVVVPTRSTEGVVARGNQIHQEAWAKVLDGAWTDAYYRYAIYASRTLAVNHPEVYLRGDSLFVDVVTSENGYARAYEIKDVHDQYFYGESLSGGPFSFDQVKFNEYSVTTNIKLYPSDYPFLPYLDRRVLPLPSTLKLTQRSLTELELAIQYYFSLTRKGGVSGSYILYCDSESAYVYTFGRLIQMNGLKECEKPSGNPILIFSQESTWYPLLGRDDRAKDTVLNTLVARYSTSIQLPSLTEFESKMISGLGMVTTLSDSRQMLLATISAAHTEGTGTGPRVKFPSFSAAWDTLRIPGTAWGLFQEIYRRANYLSPITAYLAAVSSQHEGEGGMQAMTKEYLKYTATPSMPYAHGHTWICMLNGLTIDECYRTQAGHCVWQSASLGSVLDILGIDNYTTEGVTSDMTLAHTTVYVPKHDFILNNGRIMERGTVLSSAGKEPFCAIRYIRHGGKWANPMIGSYTGTLSPNNTTDILRYLKSLHNDDIRGIILKPGVRSSMSYDEFIKSLSDEQRNWKSIELPGGGITIPK